MNKIEFVIPFLPISINNCYTVMRYNRSRRILTKEARTFKENVKTICDDEFDVLLEFKRGLKKDEVVIIEYVFCCRWINKNGTNKKKDVANFEKLLTDSIMDSIKIDDSMIWNINMTKAHSEKMECVFVRITKDKLTNYIEE